MNPNKIRTRKNVEPKWRKNPFGESLIKGKPTTWRNGPIEVELQPKPGKKTFREHNGTRNNSKAPLTFTQANSPLGPNSGFPNLMPLGILVNPHSQIPINYQME